MAPRARPLAERLWPKVDRSGGADACWPWTGFVNPLGYGKIRVGNHPTQQVGVHRASYELLVGPIPADLVIDHLCRNPSCVNPAHMEPVTNRVNVLRGTGAPAANARQTHCRRAGHPLEGDNLFVTRQGNRSCMACNRDRQRQKYRADRLSEGREVAGWMKYR